MLKNDSAYDVVITGAGISGLTAAAYLCSNGYRVMLCEKNEKIGGLIRSFEHNGFIFDAGIRAFENSRILFPMLKQLGIDMDFVINTISIGIESDIIPLESKDSLSEYGALLNKYFPDDSEDIEKIMQEIKKVMGYMNVLYEIDNPIFLDLKKEKEYLYQTLLPWLLRYHKNIKKASKLNQPVNDYLLQFTKNHSLIDVITQHFFRNTPTFFALSYFGLYLDYSYPKGGTEVLVQKLGEYIQHHNGHIITNATVSSINVEENQVTFSDGRNFSYEKLLWACEPKQLYAMMETTGKKQIKKIEAKKNMIKNHTGGDSILTIYLGINLGVDYFKAIGGAHCFYTPSSLGLSSIVSGWSKEKQTKMELVNQIKQYLMLTTYEISCPVLRDLSLAPKGKSGLIVSTLMDYDVVKIIHEDGWYDEFKDLCANTVIEVLDETMFIGIKSEVLFSLCSTPLTIEKITGNANGAITGWAFSDRKHPSETRLQKISKSIFTPIKDIYQTGQWSFSPSGLPVCILTGKLAANHIDKKLRNIMKTKR